MGETLGEHEGKPGNPVIPDVRAADPHIALLGDRYYIYATEAGKTEPGFALWSSPDLRSWSSEGMIYRFAESRWARGRDWAPCIAERNGRYYFYFSADDRIGVAVGDSPAGPFHDPLGAPLCPYKDDISVIDPMAFIDDDGEAYLYWGAVPAAWLIGKVTDIMTTLSVRKLNRDMISFDGPELPTVETPSSASGGYGPHVEASFVLKRDGVYYLMWSHGSWNAADDENAYRVMYATGPSPLGPWTKQPAPILSTCRDIDAIGPGHHSVVQIPGRDEWFVAYHNHKGDADRRVCIDRMEFNADGTIKTVIPTREGPPPHSIRLAIALERYGPFEHGAEIRFNIIMHDEFSHIALFAGDTEIGRSSGGERRLLWRSATVGFHHVSARGRTPSGETVCSAALNIDVV